MQAPLQLSGHCTVISPLPSCYSLEEKTCGWILWARKQRKQTASLTVRAGETGFCRAQHRPRQPRPRPSSRRPRRGEQDGVSTPASSGPGDSALRRPPEAAPHWPAAMRSSEGGGRRRRRGVALRTQARPSRCSPEPGRLRAGSAATPSAVAPPAAGGERERRGRERLRGAQGILLTPASLVQGSSGDLRSLKGNGGSPLFGHPFCGQKNRGSLPFGGPDPFRHLRGRRRN